MCYDFSMALQSAPTSRTVVLLRPSDKKKLQRLARAESVSSGEILRRSLHAYNPDVPQQKDEEIGVMVAEMNKALDAALKAVRSARSDVAQNIRKVQQLRAKRA